MREIEHNLLGVQGAKLEDVTTVYSHPQGFAQSKEFFHQYPQMELVPYFSTSKSAETVREKQDKHLAAVAGKQAAEMYGCRFLPPISTIIPIIIPGLSSFLTKRNRRLMLIKLR